MNNENGRKARATKVVFDNATGREIFAWMNDMVKQRPGETNTPTGPSQYDNLLGIRSKAGRHGDRHVGGARHDLAGASRRARRGGVELGVGADAGPAGQGRRARRRRRALHREQVGAGEAGGGVAVPEVPRRARDAGDWAAGTGYVPIRKSSVDLPAIQQLWAKTPGYKVAYDQLISGVDDIATQGPVIGAYQAVRDAVLAGEQEMFTQGKAPGRRRCRARRSRPTRPCRSTTRASRAEMRQRTRRGSGSWCLACLVVAHGVWRWRWRRPTAASRVPASTRSTGPRAR